VRSSLSEHSRPPTSRSSSWTRSSLDSEGGCTQAIALITLVAAVVLVALSPTATARFGSAVFGASTVILFTVPAALHRGRWNQATARLLTRLDHAAIFLLIAGSYTPFSLLLLEGTQQTLMLSVAWGGALLGASFRVLWTDAPRWLYTPVYVALGWTSMFFIDDFHSHGGVAVVAFIVAGAALHGRQSGLRRPPPEPVPVLVRVPRGVPHPHDRCVRSPLHGRLAGTHAVA
jgi:hemolysin III